MLPTIESVVAKLLKQAPDEQFAFKWQEYINQPYNINKEWDFLWELAKIQPDANNLDSLIDPYSRLNGEIWYLYLVNTHERKYRAIRKLKLDLATNRCRTFSLFDKFVAFPNKSNETKLLQHFTQTIQWLTQDNPPAPVMCEKNVTCYHSGQFRIMMTDVYSRLVDTYLGLLSLNLDVWTVLFIVSQLPEFDLVYDGAKVRIYERMRLFRDKCSIIKT